MKRFTISTLFILFITFDALTQSVVDEITEESAPRASELFIEKINTIGNSKRIFIISNENKLLYKGDFISILLDGNLACRALVAKVNDDRVGIKIVKIYSLSLWQKLSRNLDVQVLRGDDSYYYKKVANNTETEVEAETTPDDKGSIVSEEDLYNTKSIDELGLGDNKNRILPNDHLISLTYGLLAGKNKDGQNQNYSHWSGSWAYQTSENIFLEGFFGISQMQAFPNDGINAAATSMSARLKYAIQLPLYSYLMPYMGYQVVSIQLSNDTLTPADQALVADMEKNGIVFGATFMRRLVPGWFIKADVGTDIFAAGFTIEF
ncbi:MAG: hypothetical protein JNM93_03285 [Bacteriovoracaceae bacterium]|nr:hypothetical protein [Bacteriovoracaceae bacterium]